MPRLLRREPAIDEGELELARARSLERLRQIGAPRPAEPPDDAQPPEATRPPIEVVGVDATPMAADETAPASGIQGTVVGPKADVAAAESEAVEQPGGHPETAAGSVAEVASADPSIDARDSPTADEIEGGATQTWELSDDALPIISLPSPLGADDEEPTDNQLLATELAASALTIDERDDAWLNVAESDSREDSGFESAAAIEIAPWPAEDVSPASAAIEPSEPAEPGAVQHASVDDADGPAAELIAFEAAETAAVAAPTEAAAPFEPPTEELSELQVDAPSTNGLATGIHGTAETTPVAVAPAEPEVDIALVSPDELAIDGWASDWGIDVLAPDDLTAAAFGRTNGHLAVLDEPAVEARPDEPGGPSAAKAIAAEAVVEPIEPEWPAEAVAGEPAERPAEREAIAETAAEAVPIAIEAVPDETAVTDVEPLAADVEPAAVDVQPMAHVTAPSPIVAPAAAPRPAKTAGKKRPKPKAGAFKWPAQASCPYCAQLLVPAPTSHKRCPRCRQRVMVRRVEDRVAFLTEASVAIFESERRRVAESKHWIGPRKQWIRLAEAAGARPDKVAKVNESIATPESVYAARAVYFAAVDRSVKEARAEHDWPLAARIRRAQAAAVARLGGSSIPPPEDAVELHRDAAAIELRGIWELAKEAELVGGPCCPTCDADAGRTYRINAELHQPRLPHIDCPRGLCGCYWRLSDRDRANLERLLRRGGRA